MAFLHNLCWIEVEPRVAAIVLCILVPSIFCSVVAVSLVITSYLMANVGDLPLSDSRSKHKFTRS
jgi:hypothetical protein